jgi:hypothetical protein
VNLKTDQEPGVLNNLGWEYEQLKLFGKMISLYKKAMAKNYTLASANLSRINIENGFYDEASDILTQALSQKEHHENVEYYLNQLKTFTKKENDEEELLLEEAKKYKGFNLEFAEAISTPYDKYEIDGSWMTDYKDLKEFRIQFVSPDTLVGEHKIEFPYEPAIPFSRERTGPEIWVKRTVFSGSLINRGITYSIKMFSSPQEGWKNILGSGPKSEFTGFGILSQDNRQIKFNVEEKEKFEFFVAQKKEVV